MKLLGASCVLIIALLLSSSTARCDAVTQSTTSLRPITLQQAYEFTLKRSEELAQRGETSILLKERISQLWSLVKPRVSLTGSEILQDVPKGSSVRRNSEQAQIQLHQTLFTGLQEYLAVRQAKALSASADLALQRAQQLLYQDTAGAYLDLLSIQHELNIRREILAVTDARIKELQQRERLGRSRKSEVLAAQSLRAQTAAQLETATGFLGISQLRLRFLTGLEEDLAPEEVPLAQEQSLPLYLQAGPNRPDVLAAKKDMEASGYPIDIASRQRWPVLNLDGNYYLHRPRGSTEHLKWDTTFSLSLPLYSGGAISSQVKQAKSQRRSAQHALSLANRTAALEIRAAHQDLESSLLIVKALDNAFRLAQANAKAQADDYRSGLVTNLDVLGSINALQETHLQLDQSRIQAFLSQTRLKVAAGLLERTP